MAAALLALGADAHAELRTNDDYVAFVIEAEDNDNRDARWVLTEPGTAQVEDDPDGNHSDQAVGNAYLELLPDTRVTHDDELIHRENYWGAAGQGPKASWTLNFPEEGRYHVHIRAFSTGTEDNGIHVGLNDNWPLSGVAMQHCSAGQGWTWSSKQRHGGGGGACGVEKTIWVDVPSAGSHTFMVSAREDGFEIDRIMLIKDASDNTRICEPSGADNISCRNGSIEAADDLVDLTVRFTSPVDEASVGDEVELTAIVRNEDGFDTATDAELDIELALDDEWEIVSIEAPCAAAGEGISCELGDVEPSEPDESIELDFTLRALKADKLEVFGGMSSDSEESVPANDTARFLIDVDEDVVPAELAFAADFPPELTVGDNAQLALSVSNTGKGDASNAVVAINVPDAFVVLTTPSVCSPAGSGLDCAIGDLVAGADVSLVIGLQAGSAGTATLSAVLSADNVVANDLGAARAVTVEEAAQATTGGSDDGTTGAGSGTGATTDAGESDSGGTDAGKAEGGETSGGADTGGATTAEATSKGGKSGGSGAAGGWLLGVLATIAWRRRRAA